MHKDIKNISIRVDRPPPPVLLATDRNHYFVHVPIVVGSRPIPPDTICKVPTKTIDPQPDRFPANNHAPLGQQILDVSCAQREAVVSPNGVSNDLTRIAEAP